MLPLVPPLGDAAATTANGWMVNAWRQMVIFAFVFPQDQRSYQ